MDAKLKKISQDQLEGLDEYRSKGKEIADKIFKALQASPVVGISRVKIAGSIGKKTSLGVEDQPDFDLVVFVNGHKPPFDAVIKEFYRVLSLPPNGDFVADKITPHGLKLHVRKGNNNETVYSFDLLPAANLLSSGQQSHLAGSEIEQVQTMEALKLISELVIRNPNNTEGPSRYSSSVAEKTVEFVAKQSEFVHDVIRLAKLWNKKVSCPYLYGRSMMIELVSMRVARQEEVAAAQYRRGASIATAFQAFLTKFLEFDKNMDIFFDCPVNPTLAAVHTEYVKQTKKRPVILDPINPYNNLAINVTDDMKLAFKRHAGKALHCIQSNDNVEGFFAVQ